MYEGYTGGGTFTAVEPPSGEALLFREEGYITKPDLPSGLRCQDAPGRNRTCDLSLRRRTLYPLSYGRLGGP